MDRTNGPAVVLTRQREDNQELAAALAARGVVVREIPCVATRYLSFQQPITNNPDAVVFTSRHGVRGFFRQQSTGRRRAGGPPPARSECEHRRAAQDKRLYASLRSLQSLRMRGDRTRCEHALIAAVGRATAREIRSHDVPVDLVADPPDGTVLANLLKTALPAGSHLLMVRGNLRAGDIDSILKKAGYDLEDLVVYENVDVPIATLQPFPVAAVFIASPSAAKRLLSVNPWVKDKRMVTIGKTTAEALKKLGSTRVEEIGADPHQWIEVLFHAYQEAANAME